MIDSIPFHHIPFEGGDRFHWKVGMDSIRMWSWIPLKWGDVIQWNMMVQTLLEMW